MTALLLATTLLGPAETVTEAVHQIVATQGLTAPVRQAQIRDVAHRVMDFEAMARAATGEAVWEEITIPQRALLTDTFERFLGRIYVDKVADLVSPTGFQTLTERVSGDRAEVTSKLTVKDEDWEVVFVMTRGDGAWRIVDVVVGGISLVANYRSQFRTILKRHGIDGLLKRLEGS